MGAYALKNLYETLKTRHLGVMIDGNDVVSHFSFYNQNKAAENFQAIKRDIAVFFELVNPNWQTLTHARDNYGNEERCNCVFNLHYYRKSLKNDEDATLELIDKVIEIHRNVNLLNGDNFGNTVRVSEIQDTAHDNVIGWILTYETQLYEQANDLGRTTVDPELALQKMLH